MANTVEKSTHKLSRSRFILTAYSLTGAALMGSSIGLVAYQSRQFFFLSRGSRHNLVHPPFRPGYPYIPDHDHDNLGYNQTYEGHPSFHHQPEHHHHHHHHHSLSRNPLWSFFISTCLPVLVWIGSLFLSTTLITSRKWVPKIVSARTGMLVSQLMFSAFWTILSTIQRTQEQLVVKRRALIEADPITEAMDDTTHIDVIQEFKADLKSLVIPLSAIWYLAVIILGVATGLLTTSSNQLESQLDDEQNESELTWEEEKVLMINEKQDQEKGLTLEMYQSTIMTKAPTAGVRSLSHYTTRQRLILLALIFGLFASQMKLFEWIIHAQSMAAYIDGTTASVASCLAIVGLLSGTVMISLGLIFLPKQ